MFEDNLVIYYLGLLIILDEIQLFSAISYSVPYRFFNQNVFPNFIIPPKNLKYLMHFIFNVFLLEMINTLQAFSK
ncbi:hypothetical protein CW304_27790 [Bacillus sp. UFRGS-B20]|nr:hypothetical protein CW304_27790 [Bacillus sp. UFRGS-B20]